MGNNVKLVEINERNYKKAVKVKVREGQKIFCENSGAGIIALAYINREASPKLYGVDLNGEIIGLILVEDIFENPATYHLHELVIDKKYQGEGYGSLALKEVVNILKEEKKFDTIEICCHKENEVAIKLYEKFGFEKVDYVDYNCPWNIFLMYRL